MLVRMIARPTVALALGLGGLWSASALAQATTGTGGGPASTITAPNTTSVGQTKPPGAAAGPEPAERSTARTGEEKKDDKVMQGICIGCGVK